MPIQTQCTLCGRKINAGDTFAGKAVKCPGCASVIRIPFADGPALRPGSGPTRNDPPPQPSGEPQPPPFGSPSPFAQSPFAQPPHDELPPHNSPPPTPQPGVIYDAEDMSGRAPAPLVQDETRRPCPACGELISRDATRCRFCGERFDGTLARSGGVRKPAANDNEMAAVDWVFAVLCSPIGCIISIVYLVQGKEKGGKMLGVSILFNILFAVAKAVLQNLLRQGGDFQFEPDDF